MDKLNPDEAKLHEPTIYSMWVVIATYYDSTRLLCYRDSKDEAENIAATLQAEIELLTNEWCDWMEANPEPHSYPLRRTDNPTWVAWRAAADAVFLERVLRLTDPALRRRWEQSASLTDWHYEAVRVTTAISEAPVW